MSAKTAWRGWRREVHDILEVGGDAHPAGRVVNVFIVVLIFLNAIAFAAETVDAALSRYASEFEVFNVFSVIVFTVEYVLRVWSSVEIPMLSRLPRWRARLRFALAADHDHRPARVPALVLALDHPDGSSGSCASCACSGCSSSCAIRPRCRRSAA